ncbi:LOW QUALITY PROTEIN: hypothetical protein U9M48_031053 [Paspalum notatum var. saurae]|uniref:Reverse transcriptase domain-containing protein n=1 Tax=Paspalum notatum var. saurae TaxID=547442 RepID=A0AAQ3X3B2_PASNO
METCAKKPRDQLNVLALNDLDKEISEEVLNQLAVEDAIAEDFSNLSLHAIAGTESHGCFKLRAIVNKKVMLLLVDSGSSHIFISSSFVNTAGLHTTPALTKQVKVANGDTLTSDKVIPALECWCQGYTLKWDLRVLDMEAYDGILGFDWLEQHSLMICDWEAKTLQFQMDQQTVKLQGILSAQTEVSSITGDQFFKWLKGNDVWALALFHVSDSNEPSVVPPEILNLLDRYQDVFQGSHTLPPPRDLEYMTIIFLYCQMLCLSTPYGYSPLHKSGIERQVKELLAAGLITHSSSPFASPVLLVQKKDGCWRMCVDYTKLNALTIKNRFTLPIIEDILAEFSPAQYFTKLDMKYGYHQVRMHPENEHKTTFKTHHGHYRFKVMPFGLTNAPATFQCIMNEMLSPYLRKFVLVFLDDILIFSTSLDQHISHLSMVFDKLREHQLYLKSRKCSFTQKSVEYLGHVISQEGVATDPTKTAAMVEWPQPTSMTELRAFLGLINYYRRFVKHYGLIAKPLTQILKLKQFQWSDVAEQSFLTL